MIPDKKHSIWMVNWPLIIPTVLLGVLLIYLFIPGNILKNIEPKKLQSLAAEKAQLENKLSNLQNLDHNFNLILCVFKMNKSI